MTSKRNIGLDICRIIGMMGIVMLHILGNGGLLSAWGGHSGGYWIALAMEIAAFCVVDLFALLSGYLCCQKNQFTSFRIMELLMSLFFYTVTITGAFLIFAPSLLPSIKDIVKSLFPMLAGRYWYITCYTLVFLLMPCLNLVIQKLSNDSLKRLSILLFILLSVIPSVVAVDFFKMEAGYSAAWLAVCYLWGGAYRKLGKQLFAGFEWLVFLLSTGIVFLVRFLGIRYPGYLMQYTSPFMVINALMLLQLGANYRGAPRLGMVKSITYLSGAAFDVYLLHCHILIYDHLIKGNFSWIANLHPTLIVIAVLLCAVSIYLAGTMCDILRKCVFRVFRLDKFNQKLTALVDLMFVREI